MEPLERREMTGLLGQALSQRLETGSTICINFKIRYKQYYFLGISSSVPPI